MNVDDIVRMLQNSGMRVVGADGQFIYIEDPSCLLRGFDAFLEYAWMAIILITILLLMGWAVSLLRGAKNDIFTNMRNLFLMFAALGAVGPIMVGIWGHDYISKGCKTLNVSISEVNKILDMRNKKLAKHNSDDIWEEIDIFDSGVSIPTDESTTSINPDEAEPLPHDENAATSATTRGKDVIYTYPNGDHIRRTGGTPAWRNNNQGNIVYGKFAKSVGALTQNGRFAVFPSTDYGMTAIRRLLLSDSYKNLTIASAIARWAPPVENDTAAYQQQIANITHLDIGRTISSLNDDELDRVANAIKRIEGYTVGREIKE